MAPSRKTIPVTQIVDCANVMLALPDTPGIVDKQFRQGVIAMVERVLFDTNNYRGFNYLKSEWLPEEERNYDSAKGPIKMLRDDIDETRRVYYHPATKLTARL